MMRSKRQNNEPKPEKPLVVEIVEVIIIVMIHLVTIAGLIDTVVLEGQRVAGRFRPPLGESQPVNVVSPVPPKSAPLPAARTKNDQTAKALLVSE